MAPADFILVGATTRSPQELNPALRSRCTSIFFEPLTKEEVIGIVEQASSKLSIKVEEGAAELYPLIQFRGEKRLIY